ncbi:MAG: chitobiase/beta-hexosaminidase C-terminal domain-containing protein [Bacteroidaceae bacterium]|nr:chitobiase/beta-hexosaminidase C-terminal domain-containing protein [Bacteroidaceae bacterium]
MKQQLLKKTWLRSLLLAAITLLTGATSVWGETVTFDATTDVTNDSHTSYTTTVETFNCNDGSTWTATGFQETKNTDIGIGKGGANYLQTPIVNGTITSVAVTWSGNTSYYLALQTTDGTELEAKQNSSTSTTQTFTVSGSYNQLRLVARRNSGTSNALAKISKVVVTYSTGGSVTPTCATPTFSPAAGAVFSDTKVSISSTDGATIYYTTDGNDPTTSSSVYSSPIAITEATTIKAYAVKADYNDSEIATAVYTIKQAVSGYTIDFESDLDCYTDWTFNNIGTSNTAITAHGGSKYGANINASGNGVTTAFIQTNEPIALPNTFTCYVSKASTNTTASTWIVQVSSDGSEWTDVGDGQSAASMEKGTWVEYTVNLSGYSNVYVKLSYGSSGAIRTVDDISITMREPDEKITPVVTIDATGLTTDLAGSTNVSAGTATATVTSGDTTIEGATVTWSSSNTGVATIDASTGAVTLIAVGTTALTATFAGDDDYNEASATFELTVIDSNAPGGQDNPYTVAQALGATPSSGNSETVYVRGIVSAFYGEATGITGDNYNRYYISDDGTTTDQLLVYRGKGLNNVAFSSDDDLLIGDVVVITGQLTTYNSTKEFAANNYIVSLSREKQDPTIPVSDVTVAYGSTFTFDDSNVEGGDVTLTSSITKVATVNGLTITPKAVGTTTITVATAESVSYNAGIATFTLTVTAPEGQTTAPDMSVGEVIFYEPFNAANGTGPSGDIWNGTIANTDFAADNEGWSGNHGMYSGDGCAKFGKSKEDGDAITPAIAFNALETYTLTFKAGAWNGDNTTLVLSCDDANAVIGTTTFTMLNNAWSEYTTTIKAAAGSKLTFASTGTSYGRFFLDDVKVEIPAGAQAESYTIPSSGVGTYCSQYPINLDELPDGVTAYVVESQTSTSVTLAELTGSIKGGVGFVLKGTPNTPVTFTFADSETVPETNQLYGTIAPTYVAEGTVYGMQGGQFHSNNSGTIPAHRAYLLAEEGSSIKALTLVFKDADGITETSTITDAQTIYNLTGRRLQGMQKGVNIVGGKKVLVK